MKYLGKIFRVGYLDVKHFGIDKRENIINK